MAQGSLVCYLTCMFRMALGYQIRARISDLLIGGPVADKGKVAVFQRS